MPGRAKSDTKKQQMLSELKEEWIKWAADKWLNESAKGPEEVKLGLRVICTEAEELCFKETGKRIKIDKQTVSRRAKGGRSIRESNAEEKGWLNKEETEAVLTFAITVARQGFPLTHRRIKEAVDEIAGARHGNTFPATGVGKNWTDRFVEKHSERLRPYWSRSLDHSRAQAVNKNNNEAYYDILEAAIEGNEGEEPISPECIWGSDESGLQGGVGNLPPAVIFKGEAYHTKWKQDNPLNAAIGYSKKGYTTGEIGVAWIQHFDTQTTVKAAGRRRLLLVDGHNSHYTKGFLDYARTHHIIVICYPSHATHVYQGLDVVIFGALKRYWTEAHDNYERRTGQKITKQNFLEVYAQAHTRALTSINIRAAFRKTGVVPFDCNVITAEMMAPSQTTAIQSYLPYEPAPAVQAVIELLRNQLHMHQSDDHYAECDVDTITDSPSTSSLHSRPADALPSTHTLQNTPAAFLTQAPRIRSTNPTPSVTTLPISPFKQGRYRYLLDAEPQTHLERELQAALCESETCNEARKAHAVGMQATAVLQGLYVERSQSQLQATETRAQKKTGRLFGDGLPKLLTGDEFYQEVVDYEERIEHEREQKEQRKAQCAAHAEVIAEWKTLEEMRKARNKEKRAEFDLAVKKWEVERDKAKQEHRRPAWRKPELKTLGLEKAIPRPKLVEEDSEEGDCMENEQNADESDESE